MPLKLQTKETITNKLTILYNRAEHLKAYLKKETFEVAFSFKRLSARDIEQNFNQINRWVKELRQLPFEVEFQQFSYRSLGEQSLPHHLKITKHEFFSYLGKKEEFLGDISLLDRTLRSFPKLQNILTKEPKMLMEYRDVWDNILNICHYFVKYPRTNLYIRELDIEGVDSKFIEQHKRILDRLLEVILEPELYDKKITKISNYGFENKYGLKYDLPIIRFRILDSTLYINGLDDLSLPVNLFESLDLKCEDVYITENKINGLTFPKRKNAIVIFGLGYGIEILKEITWLKDKKLYYWGDIDTHGFAMLSQIRSYFPTTKSILMNYKTLMRFKHLAVIEHKPFRGELTNLTKEEKMVFSGLKEDNFGKGVRIEQERIPYSLLN